MPLRAYIETKAVVSYLGDIEKIYNEDDVVNIEKESRRLYPCDNEQENIDTHDFFLKKYKNDRFELYKDISEQLFSNKNGHIILKSEKLEEYNYYTTSLDTYPFFATKLIGVSKDLTDINQRVNYISAHIDESFSFDSNLEEKLKEISDNHIHLGASLDFHYAINRVIIEPYKFTDIDAPFNKEEHSLEHVNNKLNSKFYIFISLFESIIIEYFLDIQKNKDNKESNLFKIWNLMDEFIKNKLSNNYINDELYYLFKNTLSIRRDNFLSEYIINEKDEFGKGILDKAYKNFRINKAKLGDKLLVIYLLDKFSNLDRDTKIYKVLKSYFTMRNIFKQNLLQQHRRSGFAYFSSYSRNPIKKAVHDDLIEIFDSVFHPRIDSNIEFRVAIDNTTQELHNWVYKFHYEFKKFKNLKKNKTKFLFHYIKTKDNQPQNIRHKDSRKNYKNQTLVLTQFLTNTVYRYKEKIDLAHKYFHGIDCAGNELYTPPEVFAPIYNFFKKSALSSGLAISTDICKELPKKINLQYSYHVGEEFRDIISGVRSIFEAIIFLNLNNEDRLGHSVALGIDVNTVFRDRHRISLSKGEYMDNLVFLYYIFSLIENPPYSLEKIKNLIVELGNEIYGEVSDNIDRSFGVDDYIAGWLLRRNCPVVIQEIINWLGSDKIDCKKIDKDDVCECLKNKNTEGTILELERAWNLKQCIQRKKEKNKFDFIDLYDNGSFERAYTKAAMPDFFYDEYVADEPLGIYLNLRNNKKAYILYWAYETNEKVLNKYDEPYLDRVEFPYDVYEYLQDYIMEKYVAGRDLVIEVLPTSNVLITSLTNYDDHPFVRFYPPKDKNIEPNKFNIRKKKIRIVLGTDDPGIQGTNLMMEYHLIHETISKKYSKRIADDYVEKLAKFGNFIFNKGE